MAVYALAALLLFRMLTLDLSNESNATGRKTARGIRSATWSAKRGAHGCISSAREHQRDRESKNVPRLASRCPRWTPRCSANVLAVSTVESRDRRDVPAIIDGQTPTAVRSPYGQGRNSDPEGFW